jgi:hypothetical protein
MSRTTDNILPIVIKEVFNAPADLLKIGILTTTVHIDDIESGESLFVLHNASVNFKTDADRWSTSSIEVLHSRATDGEDSSRLAKLAFRSVQMQNVWNRAVHLTAWLESAPAFYAESPTPLDGYTDEEYEQKTFRYLPMGNQDPRFAHPRMVSIRIYTDMFEAEADAGSEVPGKNTAA